MPFPNKLPALAATAVLAAASLAVAPASATAGSDNPTARAAAGAAGPKVVHLHSNDRKVVASDTRFRPGVTEFRVGRTTSRGTSLLIIQSDNLQAAFGKFQKAINGGPGSADAMKAFDRMVTIYSGGESGARWQVRLGRGSYYVIDTKTNKMTTLTVKGPRRHATMVRPDSRVWATKQNQFETSGDLAGPWVSFANHAREIHFLDAGRVEESTTPKDVQEALTSPKQPKWVLPGGFHLEVESPGVRTVHFQNVRAGKYLLICWMPSEEQDGVPHAMMGMWSLVPGV